MEFSAQFLISVESWLLAVSFAAVWGAHLYQTTVLFPEWVSEPPKSVIAWLATPYAMRVLPEGGERPLYLRVDRTGCRGGDGPADAAGPGSSGRRRLRAYPPCAELAHLHANERKARLCRWRARRIESRSADGQDAGPAVGPMELRAFRRRDGRIDRGALRGQSFLEKHLPSGAPVRHLGHAAISGHAGGIGGRGWRLRRQRYFGQYPLRPRIEVQSGDNPLLAGIEAVDDQAQEKRTPVVANGEEINPHAGRNLLESEKFKLSIHAIGFL